MDRSSKCDHSWKAVEQYLTVVLFVFNFPQFVFLEKFCNWTSGVKELISGEVKTGDLPRHKSIQYQSLRVSPSPSPVKEYDGNFTVEIIFQGSEQKEH